MKILTLFIAGMLIFALSACGKTETVYLTPEPSAVETPAPQEQPDEVLEYDQEEVADTVPEYVINLYFGDDNAENILHEGIIVNDLAPQVLLDKLLEKGVFSEAVTANSFTVDNYNIIHLDLSPSFATQLGSMGTSGEYIMLGSLANTFMDAFDADGLSLSIEGNVLETGHNVYDYTIEFYQ